jgi:hypothetical protein
VEEVVELKERPVLEIVSVWLNHEYRGILTLVSGILKKT